MKARVIRLGVVVGVVAALLLFIVPVALASPTANSSGGAAFVTDSRGEKPVVLARRIISPTKFGIASAELVASGVEVEGHGDCPEDGETFKVRVTVTQVSTGARAKSQFVDFQCGDHWTVVAEPQGPNDFATGQTVEVCAMAVTQVPNGGNWVRKWCKVVPLE